MDWNLEEALSYYGRQGAPKDQTALTALLREIQQNSSGSIPVSALHTAAEYYGVQESFLLALVKRIPSLRMGTAHQLILCAGPNCGKHAALAAFAEKLQQENPGRFTLKFGPCMRLCGKGPNIKWDGTIYHRADKALLQKLIEE